MKKAQSGVRKSGTGTLLDWDGLYHGHLKALLGAAALLRLGRWCLDAPINLLIRRDWLYR